jgi:hypothetical protein
MWLLQNLRRQINFNRFSRGVYCDFAMTPSRGHAKLNSARPLDVAVAESWEKHFARSERRIGCRRQTTEAQSEAKTPSKKMQSIFFDPHPDHSAILW